MNAQEPRAAFTPRATLGQGVLEEDCATMTWLAPGPEVPRPSRFPTDPPGTSSGLLSGMALSKPHNREVSPGYITVDEAPSLMSLSRKVLLWVRPAALMFTPFRVLAPGLWLALGRRT